jgi:2,3-bisphosphoglycerate-independent phosphoglycerate mutase
LENNTLSKQLTTPLYKNRNKQQTQKVGEITKEFIEKNKEVLEEEKTKREEYDPT